MIATHPTPRSFPAAPLRRLLLLLAVFLLGVTPLGAEPAQPAPSPPAVAPEVKPTKEVLMYSTSWCGYCRKMRVYLDAIGADWHEVDIEKDPKAGAVFRNRYGRSGVPVLEIGPAVVKGYRPEEVDQHLRDLRASREAQKKEKPNTAP